MNRSELFEIWAPPNSVWSPWAKPALFAEMPLAASVFGDEGQPTVDLPPDALTTVIVDLPGLDSVRTGLALAANRYRPVPLFNTAFHLSGVVNVESIARCLVVGADQLARLRLPHNAPPAFLLDAHRSPGGLRPSPGRFDNRWIVFPQDFPSATFLLAQGLRRVLLMQGSQIVPTPQSDLAHVLLRWQEAGLEILRWDPAGSSPPQILQISQPSWFGSLWYRTLVLAGLRRNSAGGFGSVVPQPSSSHG